MRDKILHEEPVTMREVEILATLPLEKLTGILPEETMRVLTKIKAGNRILFLHLGGRLSN